MGAIVQMQQTQPELFTEERKQLIKDSYCRDASDLEFELFMAVCNRLQLDPVARQIYAVKRWDSGLKRMALTPQISIDGQRLVAERSGRYEGQTEPLWCGKDGKWKDVWLSKEPPAAAKVGVYRTGCRDAIYAVARWDSYAQRTKNGDITKMWASMGDVMLAKCAESLALRKAFPAELSGAYTDVEMAQSGGQKVEPSSNGGNVLDSIEADLEAPKPLLSDWIEKIEAAASLDELQTLGACAPKMSAKERDEAKGKYLAKFNELAPVSPTSTTNAEMDYGDE